MSTSRPTLSLQVLAARADRLGDLLAHHRDLWDEAVVVDTGEGTAAAAAVAAGALAVSHLWQDDFAAARNAGLEAATAEWILILDTDELIAPADFARLRAWLAGPDRVGIMPAVNYHDDSRHPEWRPVAGRYPAQEEGQTGWFLSRRAGLFPRRDDLRFRGRIHESILPAATAARLPHADVDVVVHHYGYVQGGERNRRRRERDAALIRRKRAEQPDDPAARLEYATLLLEAGEIANARVELEALAETRPVDSAVTRGRFLLGRLRREQGEVAAAAACLRRAVADDPRLLHAWIEWIRCEADRADWATCAVVLEQARRHFGTETLLDREELRILLKTGRLDAAATVLARMQRVQPHWQDLQGLSQRLRRLLGKNLPGDGS